MCIAGEVTSHHWNVSLVLTICWKGRNQPANFIGVILPFKKNMQSGFLSFFLYKVCACLELALFVGKLRRSGK